MTGHPGSGVFVRDGRMGNRVGARLRSQDNQHPMLMCDQSLGLAGGPQQVIDTPPNGAKARSRNSQET